MPTQTIRRGVLRWRGVVKMEGEIVASKWFGKGQQEQRKAILWEEGKKREIEEKSKTTLTACLSPLAWANDYLTDMKRNCVSKTYQEKKTVFVHLLKFAGSRPLAEFSPDFAKKFLNKQFDTRSGYSANKDRKNLSAAWEWGKKYLDGFPNMANPFLVVVRYKEERHDRYIPPEEDFWKVFELSQGQDKVMLTAFLYLAARRGEVFRLKWSDVDFHEGRIRLTTMKTHGGEMRADWLPMTKALKSVLLGWWQERPFKQSEHVFTMLGDAFSAKYGPGDPFICRQHFMRKLCDRAEVKPFGFHAIRHFSAVTLYKAGESMSMIQKILRHQHPGTTERYLRSLGFESDQMRDALENLNKEPAKVISLPQKARTL